MLPVPSSFPLLAWLLATAIGCGGSDSTAPAHQAEPASTPAAELTGHWRLIDERTVDGKPVSMRQQVRELILRADGSYQLRSSQGSWDAGWQRSGQQLTLHRQPPSATPAADVTDRRHIATIESLTAERLVLVEPPPTAYRIDPAQPRTVRNTYRRVSESAFGPLLGTTVTRTRPAPGRYTGSYSYRASKYPTMEIHISTTIDGHAVLELADDGTVTGCLAVHAKRRFSESKYSSDDGKHHTEEQDDRQLLGVRGSWNHTDNGAQLTLAERWLDQCAPGPEPWGAMPLLLQCVGLAPSDRLPVATLACRFAEPGGALEALTLNPADSPRAGPYTLQGEPRREHYYDRGTPWLLLGAAPGLRIEARDDRSNPGPKVEFTAEEKSLVESRYRSAAP